MMDTLLQDIRYALRTLAKSPGFTLVAVLTLALGIGANTAIFSVFYGVLLRPLPYVEPDRIVGLAQTYAGVREARNVTYVQFQFLERNNQVFESLAGSASVGFNFSTGTQTDRVYGLRVSKDYFRVLGIAPALGRTFFAEEDQPNGPSAAILSYGLWQRRFGGDSGVIGRTILLDGIPTTVAGVMPLTFRSPNGAEAWSTLAQVGRTVGGGSNVTVIGRLRPGLSVGQASATMGLRALMALAPNALPSTADIRLDRWVLAFTFGLSLVTGLVFGAIPAWQAARGGPHEALKHATARVAGTARQGRLRRALVVGEIALSLILLVGAGLLIQTFARLIGTDPGFNPQGLVAAEIWLTGTRYDSTPAIAGFYRDLTARLEALPGVTSAAVVEAGLPLQRGGNATVEIPGQQRWSIDYRSITPGFFRTLGTPVIDGRDFT